MGKRLGEQESTLRRRHFHHDESDTTSKTIFLRHHVLSANRLIKLTLLRTLILWSLSSSDIVKGIISSSYKQNRHEDDLNQPLSVQAWGSDGDRRRYFLIEGLDDTHFRVYRESNHTGIKRTWWSVASDIDELKVLAEKLAKEDGGQKARLLSGKMLAAVPRFEATEEVRILHSDSELTTDGPAEAKTTRVSSSSQATIQAARTKLLVVRGSNPRKADEVYLFRR